jgi:hypothetical protein
LWAERGHIAGEFGTLPTGPSLPATTNRSPQYQTLIVGFI